MNVVSVLLLIICVLADHGQKHNFAQIWTLDTADATVRRQELMPELRSHVLSTLHELMMRHNRLARMFKTAAGIGIAINVADQNSVGFTWSATDELSNFEMASIIEHAGWQRHIVIRTRGGNVRSIDDGHQLYHALAYPLLFPTGRAGWHHAMQHNDRAISLTEYMRFMLMHRGESATHVQKCERLALEFYCDAWAQVEARNLAFHKLASQQAKYQAASARAIVDQLYYENARQIGVPIVLPASFPNSPRYYHNLSVTLLCPLNGESRDVMSRYLDAVALPRRYGKPDLFITMTANPNWPEITRTIPTGSNWAHHPDIVARVFSMKLKAMIDLIVTKKLFGEVRGASCVSSDCQFRLTVSRCWLTCIESNGRHEACLTLIA